MQKKRFIAGAVCPRCAALDRIITFEREGLPYRGCISCDFEEEQPTEGAADELPTRVNQTVESESTVQVVQIIDTKKH